MTELCLICIADEPIAASKDGNAMLRFSREGETIGVYFNGIRINILDNDEWNWLIEGMERL